MHEERSKADIAKEQSAKWLNNPKVKKFTTRLTTDPMFRMGVSAGGAGAFGILAGLVDNEEDTMLSLLGKGVAMAAIETAVEEFTIMGAKTYLRKDGLPTFALDKINDNLGTPEKFRPLAKAEMDEMTKRLIPKVSQGKLVAAGLGAAGGALYTLLNNKDEDLKEGLGNIAVGTGLGLIGKEIYDHFDESHVTVGKSITESMKKYSGAGDLGKDLLLLSQDPEEFLKHVNFDPQQGKGPLDMGKVLKQLEGGPLLAISKNLPKDVSEILDGNVGKELRAFFEEQGIDWEELRTKINHNMETLQEGMAKTVGSVTTDQTTSSPNNDQVKATQKIADPEAFKIAETEKANRMAKTLKIGGIAAAVAIGAGTILDVGNDLRKERETERMKQKQEKELQRKQGREDRILQQNNYSYVDFGMIVQELFDERTGHYKMGNSKFY